MHHRIPRLLTSLLVATVAAVAAPAHAPAARSAAPDTAGAAAYRHRIDAWHAARVARLRKPDGWLALVGLYPLEQGANRFGSGKDNQMVFPKKAPHFAGTLYVQNHHLELAAMEGAGITNDGKPVQKMSIESDANGKPTVFEMGSFEFYVIDRGGELYLRLKDRESPILKEFKGIERFPVDRKWRVVARFERYDPPKPIKVPNVLGYDYDEMCPGALVFELAGKKCRLEPVTEGKELFIVFGDETSGMETYGGGRFLYADQPGADSTVVLDFNEAYNPPCAFTPYATCPLPHKANILRVRVEAGEKAYGDAHPHH